MNTYKLSLCYDGTRYSGWQKQGNTENTIQYKIETLLTRLLGESIEVHGAGRTDAGVHAKNQVCSFKTSADINCSELLAEIRKYLPDDIGAVSLLKADERFHARLNCKGKTYVYRIWNSSEPNVFERKYMYKYESSLDTDSMLLASKYLMGEHDFSAFTSAKHMKKSAVRRIDIIEISTIGSEIRITVTGSGFLYNMVRIIVGTLIEVGSGQRSAESVDFALQSKTREYAGFTAPACGLTLYDIYY